MKTLSAFFAVMMGSVAIATSAHGEYRLLEKVPVPGDGYIAASAAVDSAQRRLYVSHLNQVEVFDADSHKPVGKIDNTRGAQRIAIAPEQGRGFTSNGAAASVTIFDLKTLATIGEVKAGAQPSSIVYDPASKRVFTFNRRAHSVTAIDAGEGEVAGTIELDARPEFALSDGKGHIFVSLWEREAVQQIDAQKLTIGASWPLAPGCERPAGLALDQKNARLFVRCENRLIAVLDANNGRLITTVPNGTGKYAADVGSVEFDPETRLLFSASGDGSVTVIQQDSPDKYSVRETLTTGVGARNMALDLKTHKIFLPTADPDVSKMGSGGNVVIYLSGTFRILAFGQ
jgi:DNA-binding beta-propeller fold protein YncE